MFSRHWMGDSEGLVLEASPTTPGPFKLISNRAERCVWRGMCLPPVLAVEPCKAVGCQSTWGFWFLNGETARPPEDGAAADLKVFCYLQTTS